MPEQVEGVAVHRARLPWFGGWTVVAASVVLQAYAIGLFA
jgi:hypothetical protein